MQEGEVQAFVDTMRVRQILAQEFPRHLGNVVHGNIRAIKIRANWLSKRYTPAVFFLLLAATSQGRR